MKRFGLIFISSLLFISGCGKKDIMDVPMRADNFQELADKLEKLCDVTDNKTCGYLNGAVYAYIPDYRTDGFAMTESKKAAAEALYKKLNGKTPNQIIEVYKSILMENLNNARKRDEAIIKNLDDIKNAYEKTKNFAADVSVAHVSVDFRKKNAPVLSFNMENKSPFNIRQIVAEAEFYTASETLLGREKAFSYPLNPPLAPGKSAVVQTVISTVSPEDMELIRAAKNLKIKVLVSSLQTDSKNENESVLVLALPHSYFKMRKLIEESDKLYEDTVNKIKAINSKN